MQGLLLLYSGSGVILEIFVPIGLNSDEVLYNITPCWPFYRTAVPSIIHKTIWLVRITALQQQSVMVEVPTKWRWSWLKEGKTEGASKGLKIKCNLNNCLSSLFQNNSITLIVYFATITQKETLFLYNLIENFFFFQAMFFNQITAILMILLIKLKTRLIK